jgi:uncharacterized membrane protein YkoI
VQNIPRLALDRTVRQLFPLALLILGNSAEAKAAVIDAVVAAVRKNETDWQNSARSRLLRICESRAEDTVRDLALPEGSPLEALGRLPASGCADLALLLTGTREEAADARGISADELEKRCDKALWQLTFVQDGSAPDLSALQEAAARLPISEDMITAAEGIEKGLAETAEAPKTAKVHEIVRSSAPSPSQQPKHTVSVPLWAIAAAGVLILGLAVGLIAAAVSRKPIPADSNAGFELSTVQPEAVREISEHRAPAIAEAQDQVLAFAQKQRSDVIFLSTKLVTGERGSGYEITFVDSDGVQSEYALNSASGAVTLIKSEQTETVPDADGWLSCAQLRAIALDFAGLETAVFTKEKLDTEGDVYYYKYEFTDSDGRSYTVHANVVTGALMKYSVKEADLVDSSKLISADAALEQALMRAGGLRSDQGIITKQKREGTVYLIAFTLDEGTQYSIELNALTGMANTVDVHPVTADTSQMLGMLAARDTALQRSGLDAGKTRFTKAKLDRSNAVYVYELEYETDDNEYEISMNAVTGEILKYRVWML